MLALFLINFLQANSIDLSITSNSEVETSNIDLKRSENFKGLDWISDFDVDFTVDLSVGTPSQSLKLKLVMDSSFTFLVNNSLISNTSGFKTSSLSFHPSKKSFKFNEYFKEISGNWASDSMSISSLESFSQTFGLITNHTALNDFKKDGILGLGLRLVDRKKGLIYNLYENKRITKKIFSIYINDPEVENDHSSVLTLGEWDSFKYGDGIISSVKVNKLKKRWMSGMTSVLINGKKIRTLKKTQAVFDLGSPYLELNSSVYMKYQEEVLKEFNCLNDSSRRVLRCPCIKGKYSKLPQIGFEVNSQIFNIHPESYVHFVDEGNSSGTCFLLVRSRRGKKMNIGYPFFKEHYTMFDYSKHEIRFTKANRNMMKSDTLKSLAVAVSAVLSVGVVYIWRFRRYDDYQRIIDY
jgi:hypothetical protein